MSVSGIEKMNVNISQIFLFQVSIDVNISNQIMNKRVETMSEEKIVKCEKCHTGKVKIAVHLDEDNKEHIHTFQYDSELNKTICSNCGITEQVEMKKNIDFCEKGVTSNTFANKKQTAEEYLDKDIFLSSMNLILIALNSINDHLTYSKKHEYDFRTDIRDDLQNIKTEVNCWINKFKRS